MQDTTMTGTETRNHEAPKVGPKLSESPTPRPLRICFLIDRLDTAGTETQLLALIRRLDRSRFEPYLVLLDGEDDVSRALEPRDCSVMRLGVRKLAAPHTVKILLDFRLFLRETLIDVLQVYLQDSMYFGVVAGRLAGVRCIVRTRNNINHWMTPIDRRLGRLLNRLVAVTVCNSEAGRAAVLADERPEPGSVVVIENGVDLERFAHIPPVSGDQDSTFPRRVGMVANLRYVKGVDIFIKAASSVAASHPNVSFDVAGEGQERPELERLIAALGLEGRFVLHGQINDVPAFLAGLDVAVLSSRAEGMPNAILEYMAAGRPIVASRVGGVCEILDDLTGITVAPENPDSLAQGITHSLENPHFGATVARLARQKVEDHYSRESCVRRFENLWHDMVEKHGRNRPW